MAETGVPYARLATTATAGAPLPLDADDRYALLRLGPESFIHWALRGHLEHSNQGG